MEPNIEINFLKEIQTSIGKPFVQIEPSLASSYGLLHEFARNSIIPVIKHKKITVATVELTTCGLITDLLTGSSGASHYFILGMIPYSNEMKIKLGLPSKELSYGGYGVASTEAAKDLARHVIEYSGAKIGIAETGLLASSELEKRRTSKNAGEVFAAIASNEEVLVRELSIQKNLSRRYMRHEIAFRVLQFLLSFLKSYNP